MDIYLPIANLSVNGLWIVGLGLIVGILSGMFGVGGGFLTTPLLIFTGIPPTVAAASAASQVTGSSVSGVLAHLRRGGVDFRMALVIISGGIVGTGLGALLFQLLSRLGQIDTVINLLYVVVLLIVGGLMLRESLGSVLATRRGAPPPARKRRHHPLVAALPLRWRFYRSGLYISPLAPFLLGVLNGILTMMAGVGGGFMMIPAMLYLLGMGARVVLGTNLLQVVFITIGSTLMHSVTTHAVDIVLASLLLLGSVTGAQIGVRLAQRLPAEYLRLALALLLIIVALRIALGLGWRPDEIYTVQPL